VVRKLTSTLDPPTRNTHTHTHTYTHTHKHRYRQAHTRTISHTYRRAHTFVCVCVFICVCICVHICGCLSLLMLDNQMSSYKSFVATNSVHELTALPSCSVAPTDASFARSIHSPPAHFRQLLSQNSIFESSTCNQLT